MDAVLTKNEPKNPLSCTLSASCGFAVQAQGRECRTMLHDFEQFLVAAGKDAITSKQYRSVARKVIYSSARISQSTGYVCVA